MQNSAYRHEPEEKKELTIHQLKDYYGMLDASSTINTGDEFDARAEAKKLVKAWKKTEAEAERIKENAEKFNNPIYQNKPQNKISKREVDEEIQRALEEVKREKRKEQNVTNLNSSQTTLSSHVMSRLYKWEFQPLEDEEPTTINNRRDFGRSRRDDSLSDYSKSPGRSTSPSMRDGYKTKSRILDKVYDLRKEERSRERSPGGNSTLGASLSQISRQGYSARDGYSTSMRPLTAYDRKTGVNKMYLDPILENEDIENKLKKFEDEIKQDREKIRNEQKYRKELEDNKKNIDKTLNEMKAAHEESRMAYLRFTTEKFTIRVEKVMNNLAMYYKRQFYISLLTGLYDQNVRLGKHQAKMAFKTKSLHFCAWMEYVKMSRLEKEIQRKEMSIKQEQELERRMDAHYRRRLIKKFFIKGFLKHHLLTKQEKEIVAAQGVMKLKVNNFISKLKQNMEAMPEPRIATPERFSMQASQATTHNNRYQEESPADTEYYGTPQRSASKSPHDRSPVNPNPYNPYNPYVNTKSPTAHMTPNSASKSKGLTSPISRTSYTERVRPETGNSATKKNLDQGTQSTRNSVHPVDIVFPGNQSQFQNISAIPGSNMGISKISNNSVFNTGPSPNKYAQQYAQVRIDESQEVEEPRIVYTQGAETVDYMYSPSRAPSDSRVTNNLSDVSRGRVDNKENTGSHLPSLRGTSAQKSATNNTMNTTSTTGAGAGGKKEEKKDDKKPAITMVDLEQRAKERKDKAAFIKAKHEEEKKKKELEKREREQREREEQIRLKLEEKKKLEDKRKQERLAKERKEQEEAAMIMKMSIAKDVYHRSLMRYYGFLAFYRIKEMKVRHNIRANEYRRRALLRRGIENWLQGLTVIKVENEARLADKCGLADAHYEGTLLRLGFSALIKNRVICQDQYKGFENYRVEYIKRKCFSKWFEGLGAFRREKYEIESHYDSIIQRFQMMILFQRTLKSLKKNVEENRIEKLKKEHRDIMWSKVNGWLDEFNKGKSSK